ncbi:MAG: GGDEF domain-containing protein [Synechococcales cyanobacterium RU_4_20]|nr:GGDEF domain-containing protein [Synechococcales cyanobacterium RU_4_20]
MKHLANVLLANPFLRVIRYLENQPPLLAASLSLLLVFLIGTVDTLIPSSEMTLSIVYAVPILMAAWFAGIRFGSFISVTSAICWLSSGPIQETGLALTCWNTVVSLGFFLLINYLLSALKSGYERERRLARTDGLTGLTNRRYFHELLEAEFLRSRRYHYPLTLAYIDVDNFKEVNDRFGHGAGDILLSLMAKVMVNQLRAVDVVARLGGDEFALMLPQTHAHDAQVVLPRVQAQLMRIVRHHGWPISFSIGVATFVKLPPTVQEIVEQADGLMYDVKLHGKNRIKYEVIGTATLSLAPTSKRLMVPTS